LYNFKDIDSTFNLQNIIAKLFYGKYINLIGEKKQQQSP